MKINIENPNRLVNFVEKSLTSWKIQYVGDNPIGSMYEYVLKDKEQTEIRILVQIYKETQQMYNPESFEKLDSEWVKIYCKDANVPLARGCTKFIRVEEFKDMRRVLNYIHNGGVEVMLSA